MKLVKEDDPILYEACDKFDFENPAFDLDETLKLMRDVMKRKNGAGLAAPQVGVNSRIFLMVHDNVETVCINPEIFTYSDKQIIYKEGCLSFPNLRLTVKRPEVITVSWYDENGKEHQDRLSYLQSRIFQHEMDHVDGITFQDRVSKLKLKMAETKRKKKVKL